MRMSSSGGRRRIATAGIIAVAALVAALVAGAARTAAALQTGARPADATAVNAASAVDGPHLTAPGLAQSRPGPSHRRWHHPLGTARDTLAIGLPLAGPALALVIVAAVLLPPRAKGVPAVALRHAVGRGPPALVV